MSVRKTQCFDGKVQFRGLRRKKIVMFIWVNEQIFFKPACPVGRRNEENGLFGQTLINVSLLATNFINYFSKSVSLAAILQTR